MKKRVVDSAVAKARARLATHKRWHPDDSEGIAERERDFKAAVLEKHIRETNDEVELTTDQRRRLVRILISGWGVNNT